MVVKGKRKTKSRYMQFPFAEGWGSVSQISGIPEKPFLYGWYYKNCKHSEKPAYQIVKESQNIGQLLDRDACIYFGDKDVPKVSDALVKKEGEARDFYYQSLRNFQTFVEAYNPQSVLAQEVVYSKKHKFIGTFDRLLRVDGKLVLVDWKATNFVGYSYKLQLEAYYRALTEMLKDGIIKIEGKDVWHKEALWIVQLPKKEEISLEKNVIKFEPDEDRFKKGFLGLLDYYYQHKKEK